MRADVAVFELLELVDELFDAIERVAVRRSFTFLSISSNLDELSHLTRAHATWRTETRPVLLAMSTRRVTGARHGAIHGRLREDAGSVYGRLGEDAGSIHGRLRGVVGSIYGRLGEDARAIHGRLREGVGSIYGRLREDVGSIHGRLGEDARAIHGRFEEEM